MQFTISAKDANVSAVLRGVTDELQRAAQGAQASFGGLGVSSSDLEDKLKGLARETKQHNKLFGFYGAQLAEVTGVTKGLGREVAGLGIAMATGSWVVGAVEGWRLVSSLVGEHTAAVKKDEEARKTSLAQYASDLDHIAEAWREVARASALERLGPGAALYVKQFGEAQTKVSELQTKIVDLQSELDKFDPSKPHSAAAPLQAGITALWEKERVTKELTAAEEELARAEEKLRQVERGYQSTGKPADQERIDEKAAEKRTAADRQQAAERQREREREQADESRQAVEVYNWGVHWQVERQRAQEHEQAEESRQAVEVYNWEVHWLEERSRREKRELEERAKNYQRFGAQIGNALGRALGGAITPIGLLKEALGEVVQQVGTAAIAQVTANAQAAASGAAASQASIPIVGPALAAAAMASTLAMVLGLISSIPSAEGGFSIGPFTNPLTQLHKNEMVLPADLADRVRAMSDVPAQGAVQNHYWTVQAIDTASFRRYLRRNQGALLDVLQDAATNRRTS